MKPARTCFLPLLSILLAGLPTGLHAATITAGFDGGNSTATVDAWTGMAGVGWVGAWIDSRSSNVMETTLVTSANPLRSGSGNYLATTFTASGGSGEKFANVARIASSSTLDYARPVVISCLFRPEGSTIQSTSTYYRFILNNNAVELSTGGNNLFVITGGSSASPNWVFSGRTEGGGTTGMAVDSGIAVVTDHVYSFTFTLDIASKSFLATVTDLDTAASFTTPAPVFYRYGGAVGNLALEFGAYMASATSGAISFSIDDISVSTGAIPEPATGAILGSAAVLLIAALFRHCQR
ncbi:MAG: hypothetical protein LBK99_23545 [Opitutaceae bacterium]|jgi:hypothetical protein|nr:hypothetical protein [Opitutaceae bacterium]